MQALTVMLIISVGVAGCAHPLEQIVEQRHHARIEAANANHPLTRGAADGLGSTMVGTTASIPRTIERSSEVKHP